MIRLRQRRWTPTLGAVAVRFGNMAVVLAAVVAVLLSVASSAAAVVASRLASSPLTAFGPTAASNDLMCNPRVASVVRSVLAMVAEAATPTTSAEKSAHDARIALGRSGFHVYDERAAPRGTSTTAARVFIAAEGSATWRPRARGALADEAGSIGPWSTSARIKAAGLPTRGPIRYMPPKNYRPGSPLPRGPQGFMDRFGNQWKKGPSRTPGDAFEWDVQLSDRGRSSIGRWSRDGNHVNVTPDGWVSH